MLNRRESLEGLLGTLLATGASSAPSRWPDSVFSLENAKTTREPYGELTVFYDGPTQQIGDMAAGSVLLNPGQEPHPPHQHPEEEFILVTEGQGEILVHGKRTPVGRGALMYCQGNQVHGIKNTGSTPFRFYYFKWLVANRT